MNKRIFSIALLMSIFCLQSCQLVRNDVYMDVVSIEKKINTDAPDHELCSTFRLTKAEVIAYFSIAKEVDEHEFHYESLILPCKYHGSIKSDGSQFQWEIFAGGSGYLYNKSIEKRYLCKEDCCNALPGLC